MADTQPHTLFIDLISIHAPAKGSDKGEHHCCYYSTARKTLSTSL